MTQAQKVDKLESDLSDLSKRVTAKVDKLESDLSDLSKRVTALEVLPNEVAEVKRDIGTINKQIDKLNLAVFGDGAVPIDTPIDSNNQTNKAQEVHLD